MHEPTARNRSAKMLSDALVAKTNAHKGLLGVGTGRDQIKADASLIWCAWPR